MEVDHGWRSVILNRQIELALEALRHRLELPGMPTLGQAHDQATALISEAGPALPVLRHVQLQVQLARIALAQSRTGDMLRIVADILPDARAYPGQIGHLDALARQVGIRLDVLSRRSGSP